MAACVQHTESKQLFCVRRCAAAAVRECAVCLQEDLIVAKV